jgi:hypothetical protein
MLAESQSARFSCPLGPPQAQFASSPCRGFYFEKTSRKGLASHSFKGTIRKLLKVLAVHILGQIDVLFVLATHIFFVSISL